MRRATTRAVPPLGVVSVMSTVSRPTDSALTLHLGVSDHVAQRLSNPQDSLAESTPADLSSPGQTPYSYIGFRQDRAEAISRYHSVFGSRSCRCT